MGASIPSTTFPNRFTTQLLLLVEWSRQQAWIGDTLYHITNLQSKRHTYTSSIHTLVTLTTITAATIFVSVILRDTLEFG